MVFYSFCILDVIFFRKKIICDHYTKTFGIAEFLEVSMSYSTVKLIVFGDIHKRSIFSKLGLMSTEVIMSQF